VTNAALRHDIRHCSNNTADAADGKDARTLLTNTVDARVIVNEPPDLD
jgi:hypothetical protein